MQREADLPAGGGISVILIVVLSGRDPNTQYGSVHGGNIPLLLSAICYGLFSYLFSLHFHGLRDLT